MAIKRNVKTKPSKKKLSGRRPGRPPKYKPEFSPMAKVVCEEIGFTDLKLAKVFNVAKSTINKWKKDYPEFSDSIKEGKDIFDTSVVEKSFLKRAIGYRYNEMTSEIIWVDDPKADQPTKKEEIAGASRILIPKFIATKKVRKEVVPDGKAAMEWLCNRNPKRWKKLKHVELTGKDGTDLIDTDAFKAILSVFPSEIAEKIKTSVLERLGHT